MIETYEAWKDGRPVLARLPAINEGYAGQVADWLTAFWDELLTETKGKAFSFADNLDPTKTPPEWLPSLALLLGANDEYFSMDWNVPQQREILSLLWPLLWPQRGTRAALSAYLNALGIEHIVRQSGDFIIGSSRVGDELSTAGWKYEIVLPSRQFGKPEVSRALDTAIRLYGPAWAQATIKYDDTLFRPLQLIATVEGQLISGGPNKIIRRS